MSWEKEWAENRAAKQAAYQDEQREKRAREDYERANAPYPQREQPRIAGSPEDGPLDPSIFEKRSKAPGRRKGLVQMVFGFGLFGWSFIGSAYSGTFNMLVGICALVGIIVGLGGCFSFVFAGC